MQKDQRTEIRQRTFFLQGNCASNCATHYSTTLLKLGYFASAHRFPQLSRDFYKRLLLQNHRCQNLSQDVINQNCDEGIHVPRKVMDVNPAASQQQRNEADRLTNMNFLHVPVL